MTLFETDGLLSDQVLQAKGKIVVLNKAAFDIATKANQLTHTPPFAS